MPTSTTTTTPTPTPVLSPTAEPTVTAAPPLSPTVPNASLTLDPSSGPPGTRVQGSGYLPGGPSADQARANESFQVATVCWGECPDGLSEEDVPVEWSSTQAGQFTLEFTVPSIPWLGADGPHPLVPGEYTVGVQCLAPEQAGCLQRGPQVAAVFELTGPTPSECRQGPCGHLAFSPPQGVPGTLIDVGGWAPLTEVISTPFGYSLVLEQSAETGLPPQIASVQQAFDGTLSGSFRVPLAWPGLGLLQPGLYHLALQSIFLNARSAVTPTLPGVTVTPLGKGGEIGGASVILASTPLTLTAAPEWNALPNVQPLIFQDSARLTTPSVAFDAADPERIAYCAPGSIQLSADGGASWSEIPTMGVTEVASSTGYPIFNQGGSEPPSCESVTLDPAHPQSFYAVFGTAQEPYGAPPIYFMGFVTTDSGKSWQLVPPPQGYAIAQFGGFQETSEAAQALFAGNPSGLEQAPSYVVEQTTDGGYTWASAELTCPAYGSCVRWGPAPSQISGMGAPLPQAIEVSTDGGKTWKTPSWPVQVDLNGGPSQLVSIAGSRAALFAPQDAYPFRLSLDRGTTWQVFSLPLLVGSDGTLPLYPALQMLPTGALLAQLQTTGAWQMLAPGASEWCRVAGTSLPTTPVLFAVNGDQIWWLEVASTPNGAPVPHHLTATDLFCGPQPR
jgi:hypothetical protein